MMLHRFKLAVLLLSCQSLFAEPQLDSQSMQPEPESFNNAAGALNDPTVMSKKMEQKLAGVLPPPVNSTNKGGMEDPTQMNRNFREALQGRSTSAAVAASGSAAPSSVLPDIKLVASVCSMHKDKNHVMLRINGKTEMVGVGEKITVVQGNQLIEIHVLEIEGRHAKIEVLPAKQTIILR